ncbi:MAG: hypothetical protein JWN70_1696, partial [Planctomycetaceae bacterium]|nr:hypothetical protein [Planctomycetaceae bacterium]
MTRGPCTMKTRALQVHPGLDDFSRLTMLRNALWQPGAHGLRGTEVVFLLGCGALSALSVLLPEFKLQIPGHAILRAVFGMAFGLAMVPRLGAGTVMGIGAVVTTVICRSMGQGKDGLGSIASLCLTGPCLDLVLRYVRSGPWLYVGLMGAGLLSNMSAFSVQYTDKIWHWTRLINGGGGGGGGGGGKIG